jgi:hypothetical protein
MSLVDIDPLTGREILLFEAFAYNGQYEVKATGFRGTATAGATTNLDFAIGAEDRHMSGISIILKNHAEADTVGLSVVDVDSIIPVEYRVAYPSWPTLKTFGITWNVDETVSTQVPHSFNFVAKINAGLYIRASYTSTGASNVTVKLNTVMHKKVA